MLPLGSVQCSKKIVVRPMNMALSKILKKSYEHTHELIIYINSLGLSVCDGAWEGHFVFLRTQRCRQDGGSGF